MLFWKRHKVELLNPEIIEVDLLPGCEFCLQSYSQGGHVLYQAARWYGMTQLGKEAYMCQNDKEAYGTGRVWQIVLRLPVARVGNELKEVK